MKIGVSALGFLQGKMGGTETYLRDLLSRMEEADGGHSFDLICDTDAAAASFEFGSPSFQKRVFRYAKPAPGWLIRGMLKRGLGVDLLRRDLDRLHLDLIHYPFTVISPRGLRTPTVLTFWDMQHEFYPEFFSAEELRRRNDSYPVSVASATRIIVSSEFTRKCLVERYGANPDKIHIVYTGYGAEYRELNDPEELKQVQQKYGLNQPFMYYPAATWPHKNHKTLLRALRLLKERHSFEGRLVLTGIAQQAQSELTAEIERLGLTSMVTMLGYLPYGELPYLYNLARMMVFPSLFEGFGIPVVEAMACGCPVVSSHATSLPEVVGDAGVLFDPQSVEEMAAQILRVWDSDSLRAELRSKGLERVKSFDWKDTARRTLDVYARTVGE